MIVLLIVERIELGLISLLTMSISTIPHTMFFGRSSLKALVQSSIQTSR